MNAHRKLENAIATLLGFLPILFSWAYKEYVNPRPFWGYFDHFETLYYTLGVALLDDLVTNHFDNPGIPAQVLSAALITLVGKDPGQYSQFLFFTHLLTIMSVLLGCWLLVSYLFHELDLWGKATGACIFFTAAESIQYTHYWGPESLFFLFSVVFSIYLAKTIQDLDKPRWMYIYLSSAALAICIAQKIVFLVFIPAYFLLLLIAFFDRNRPLLTLRVILFAFFGLVFSFIVVSSIWWREYVNMFNWIIGLLTRDGNYGGGEVASINITQAYSHWLQIIRSAKLWWLLLLVMFASVFVDKNLLKSRNTFALLAFVLCVVIFSFLAVSRQFELRYLLPMGFTLVLIFYLFSKHYIYAMTSSRLILFSVIYLIVIKQVVLDLNTHDHRIKQTSKLRNEVFDVLATLPNHNDNVVLYSFRFPAASYALRQHQHMEKYQIRIDQLYPNEGHFVPYSAELKYRIPTEKSHWDVLVIRTKDLAKFPGAIGSVYKEVRNYSIVLSDTFSWSK